MYISSLICRSSLKLKIKLDFEGKRVLGDKYDTMADTSFKITNHHSIYIVHHYKFSLRKNRYREYLKRFGMVKLGPRHVILGDLRVGRNFCYVQSLVLHCSRDSYDLKLPRREDSQKRDVRGESGGGKMRKRKNPTRGSNPQPSDKPSN